MLRLLTIAMGTHAQLTHKSNTTHSTFLNDSKRASSGLSFTLAPAVTGDVKARIYGGVL
jgi:hypothetical protein